MDKNLLLKTSIPVLTVFLILLSSVFMIVAFANEGNINNIKLNPRDRNDLYGQEENTYILVPHLPFDASIGFLRDLRDFREEMAIDYDSEGRYEEDDGFSTESFVYNGMKYEYAQGVFKPDFGYYIVDIQEHPGLIETWGLQRFPTYFVITTDEEYMLDDNVSSTNRKILYESHARKNSTVLLDEINFISKHGVPNNPNTLRGFANNNDLLYYTYSNISTENETTEIDVIFNVLEGEYEIDLTNFKAIHPYDGEKVYQPFEEEVILIDEQNGGVNEFTLSFEFDDDTELIRLVYDGEIEGFEVEEGYPFELRLRVR